MIFPTLKGKNGGYINLDRIAEEAVSRQRRPSHPKISPYLDPARCQKLVHKYQAKRGLAYSFGGWLEDRSFVWGGSYLEKDKMYVHLGYDFNAPVGTLVAVDRACEVVLVDDDTPLIGGWGTRMIVRLIDEPMYLIYAHIRLRLNGDKKLGPILEPGTVFGEIAPPELNGYWYPHVHVQAMTLEAYHEAVRDPESLDGYGKKSEIYRLSHWYPDPLRFVEIK